MKQSKYLYFSLLAVLVISGCKKEPFACFVNPGIVEVNEPITFQNCSYDGDSYYWWFGDGDTSTLKTPTKTYTQRGKWLAYLTVTSNNGSYVSKFNEIIEVGNRFFTEFKVNKIKFTNPLGQSWDNPASGPDLLVRYGQVTNGGQNWITQELPDIQLADFPVSYPNSIEIMLTDEPWYFMLVDIDVGTEDTMYTWKLNPNTLEWKSPMVLRDTMAGNWELEVHFEIK